MSILSEQEARDLLTRVLSYSKADECGARLDGSIAGNIRYARNTVSTAGVVSNVTLTVQSSFGKQTGVATINEFDDESLERTVRRSEELAQVAPENPEFMPNYGAAEYDKVNTWFKSTADITPEDRADSADASIAPSKEANLVASGFLNDANNFVALMNSSGMFAYHQDTNVNFTATIRTEDGTGSGWVSRDFNDISKLDTKAASNIAIQKSRDSVDAKEMEPGKYTVILEPAASVQLLANMANNSGQRPADEGRSYLSKKKPEGEEFAEGESRNRVGEKLFDERVTLYSDPHHPECPTAAFSPEGVPVKKTVWIDKGVFKTLPNSRYWARENGNASRTDR